MSFAAWILLVTAGQCLSCWLCYRLGIRVAETRLLLGKRLVIRRRGTRVILAGPGSMESLERWPSPLTGADLAAADVDGGAA